MFLSTLDAQQRQPSPFYELYEPTCEYFLLGSKLAGLACKCQLHHYFTENLII